MNFGLEDKIIKELENVFASNPKVDKAFVFGSRAKGNYRPDSDIDIAIKGIELDFEDVLNLGVKLDELNLTYKIDLLDYHKISEPALTEHIDRIGIEFYSRWKEMNLGDVCDLLDCLHKTPVYANFGYPMIRVTDINNREIDTSKCLLVNKETYNQFLKGYKPKIGDIVFSRVGSFGNSSLVRKNIDFCIGQNTTLIIPKMINSVFAFYYLISPNARNQIDGLSAGSTQQTISMKSIREIVFPFPPIQEQIGIANVLSSLDDKIDLLQRQNKTLEQLAETLFRQWFIEEAEEIWELKTLGKVFDIGIGRTPPRKEQQWFTTIPTDVKWVSIKDMGNSGLYLNSVSEYLTSEAIEKFSIPIIPINTVMLSFKMTIGRLAISTEKMVSNEAIAHFKQKNNSVLFPEFLYLFLKTYSWQQLGSTSSIVESINSQMIKEIEIIIPPEPKLKSYKGLIKPYFDKIRTNQIQLETLVKTRDNLLPKLMSGEIRVNLN